jgi:phenylpropionate dioxygenase-like ring-hydroxylating dioxygenase large terminal subunit
MISMAGPRPPVSERRTMNVTGAIRDRRFGPPRAAWFPIDRPGRGRERRSAELHGQRINFEVDSLGRPPDADSTGAWRLTERFGLVWARPIETEPDLPSLPPRPSSTLRCIAYSEVGARADYDQAVLGLVDPAHVPMIHQSWWRRSDRRRVKTKLYSPSPFGFTARAADAFSSTAVYDLVREERTVTIEFRLPSIRLERVTARGFELINLTTVTPVREGAVVLRNLILCSDPRAGLLRPVLSAAGRAFLRQDVAVLERLDGRGPHLLLVFVGDPDRPSAFYFAAKAGLARAERDGVAFENPVEPQTLKWRT